MHQYFDLVYRAAASTLSALNESDKLIRQGSGTTAAIKNLQAIRLQKAIMAIGMFSLFESVVQDSTKCKNGFAEVRRCLEVQKETALAKRFSQFYAAVNVLKHGRGESYESLLRDNQLPFRIERAGAPLFVEYDLTGVATLVDADDRFVLDCAQLIRNVSDVVRQVHPHSWL